MTPLLRSVLYIPADKPRALARLPELACDAVILDLEDAVLPQQKGEARAGAARALRSGVGLPLLLRLNGPGTPWEQDDLELALRFAPAGIVLPKAEEPSRVREVSLGLPLWLMIETPLGVQRASELARVPGVAGLIVGANDLLLGLRARATPGREALLHALGVVVLAARAGGLVALDAVHNDLPDEVGLGAQLAAGPRSGLRRAHADPPRSDRDGEPGLRRQRGRGAAGPRTAGGLGRRGAGKAGAVAVYQGRMIEELHAREARAVLERRAAQAQR